MPKQTDKELGLFFKNARHEQKLTYEELAEKAEMSSRYLKEIENGGRVPSFHKIRKLVRALNVPPEPFRSRLRSCRTGRTEVICCFNHIIHIQHFVFYAYGVGFKDVSGLIMGQTAALNMIGVVC